MTTAVKAVYEDGVFKPKEPIDLPEKTEVEVLIPGESKQDDDDSMGWKTARELIGCITEPPIASNISEDHDRYIYRK